MEIRKFKSKRARIEVTAEHIRDGEPCDRDKCPIALALVGMGYSVNVTGQHVDFFAVGPIRTVQLPKRAVKFAWLFDFQGDAKPINFYLQVPV